jgi:membrane associated rhomboid family serine protease
MIPLYDENPTLRTPIVTIGLLVVLAAVWLLVQGGGLDELQLASTVCNLGLVPGELTGKAPLGLAVPIGPGVACVVDASPLNRWTPLTSMFLHGGWLHLLGNGLFLWIFGNNVEDSMGRLRFLIFYLVCGLAAAAVQIAISPASPVPMVGASGAIAGVLGAYLVLYPRVRVHVLFVWVIFVQVIVVPAYLMLLWWIGLQLLMGLPALHGVDDASTGGVAFWAHIGGFLAGALLVKLFVNPRFTEMRLARERRRSYAGRWPR